MYGQDDVRISATPDSSLHLHLEDEVLVKPWARLIYTTPQDWYSPSCFPCFTCLPDKLVDEGLQILRVQSRLCE